MIWILKYFMECTKLRILNIRLICDMFHIKQIPTTKFAEKEKTKWNCRGDDAISVCKNNHTAPSSLISWWQMRAKRNEKFEKRRKIDRNYQVLECVQILFVNEKEIFEINVWQMGQMKGQWKGEEETRENNIN